MDRIFCYTVLGVLYYELCHEAAFYEDASLSHIEKFKVGGYIGKELSFPEGHGIYFNLLVLAV